MQEHNQENGAKEAREGQARAKTKRERKENGQEEENAEKIVSSK